MCPKVSVVKNGTQIGNEGVVVKMWDTRVVIRMTSGEDAGQKKSYKISELKLLRAAGLSKNRSKYWTGTSGTTWLPLPSHWSMVGDIAEVHKEDTLFSYLRNLIMTNRDDLPNFGLAKGADIHDKFRVGKRPWLARAWKIQNPVLLGPTDSVLS